MEVLVGALVAPSEGVRADEDLEVAGTLIFMFSTINILLRSPPLRTGHLSPHDIGAGLKSTLAVLRYYDRAHMFPTGPN